MIGSPTHQFPPYSSPLTLPLSLFRIPNSEFIPPSLHHYSVKRGSEASPFPFHPPILPLPFPLPLFPFSPKKPPKTSVKNLRVFTDTTAFPEKEGQSPALIFVLFPSCPHRMCPRLHLTVAVIYPVANPFLSQCLKNILWKRFLPSDYRFFMAHLPKASAGAFATGWRLRLPDTARPVAQP